MGGEKKIDKIGFEGLGKKLEEWAKGMVGERGLDARWWGGVVGVWLIHFM